jgi:hypothetical protein
MLWRGFLIFKGKVLSGHICYHIQSYVNLSYGDVLGAKNMILTFAKPIIWNSQYRKKWFECRYETCKQFNEISSLFFDVSCRKMEDVANIFRLQDYISIAQNHFKCKNNRAFTECFIFMTQCHNSMNKTPPYTIITICT